MIVLVCPYNGTEQSPRIFETRSSSGLFQWSDSKRLIGVHHVSLMFSLVDSIFPNVGYDHIAGRV